MPTRPGIHPQFELERYTNREQSVVRRLSRFFYVTRSFPEMQIGNSTYRAFLVRPADDLSIVLNVDRELVVLLAPYETFEIRTLQGYDEIFKKIDIEDSSRIDKSIRILVSADKDIHEKIRHYLQQDPEYPIILTYLFHDFQGFTDDFFAKRIRENYLIRDLFGYQSPLRHEYYFFGRDS